MKTKILFLSLMLSNLQAVRFPSFLTFWNRSEAKDISQELVRDIVEKTFKQSEINQIRKGKPIANHWQLVELHGENLIGIPPTFVLRVKEPEERPQEEPRRINGRLTLDINKNAYKAGLLMTGTAMTHQLLFLLTAFESDKNNSPFLKILTSDTYNFLIRASSVTANFLLLKACYSGPEVGYEPQPSGWKTLKKWTKNLSLNATTLLLFPLIITLRKDGDNLDIHTDKLLRYNLYLYPFLVTLNAHLSLE